MLISLSKRFIFISNTKTASTSFENILDRYTEIRSRGGPQQKHQRWSAVLSDYAFLFEHPDYRPESFFRFGIIRDPLEWFISWYNYRLNSKIQSALPPNTTLEQFWRKDDWVKWLKVGKKRLQQDHFVDPDGVCRFDVVLPMDMLPTYEPLLFARIAVNAKLPKANVSQKKASAADMPQSLIDEIREFWSEDYQFIETMREKARSVLCPVQVDLTPVSCDLISTIKVTPTEPYWFAGGASNIVGMAVPGYALPEGSKLVLRTPRKDRPVRWGLPSPRFANEHPDDPNVGHVRFRVDACRIKSGERADLLLMLPDGRTEPLAVIRADPNAPITIKHVRHARAANDKST